MPAGPTLVIFVVATGEPVASSTSVQFTNASPGLFVGMTEVVPTRCQTSFRTAWRKLTKAAGLAGLRFHDLRHHAITELAESQVSDQTIMAIAGHVSQKMLARYSHVRSEARRQAVMALSARPTKSKLKGARSEGYDTSNDTNQNRGEIAAPEVIEKMVGTWGLEPQTSTVSR